MSILELLAVITSLCGIGFSAKQHRICWIFYLVSSLLYGKIFFSIKLYADFILQIIFSLSSLYGWYSWRKVQDSIAAISIQPVSHQNLLKDIVLGGLAASLFGYYMNRYTDDALPWLDAILSCYSVVAQLWAAKLYKANWYLWIAVDVFYTALFFYRRLFLTAGLYIIFIIVAFIGLKEWQSVERLQAQKS
ncbi:nicotinamide riboside transporter PnuC [Zymomonas mobilis]|uniref:Nicotinamide riboside transporter PnuC n=1 Tax=Zymomonas mobilis subsp. pomaceae (strain ATCC 29192 / DSM 22645 / JCM 10191 / CCUG 17912 / NBRC 13757 / NCIMB 11200 / NRRL B-4491 / Barker I) TaxID=579138 RepID=F8EW27_ZYMMT|nr:nicotinamide riboside transporter PnuC [Zymomonas mobilis]AEI38437.1 nicotinamide mononucleotide transporter PnuC [Zymomonas mobilis subsp. pomaceae ATCC 29192]MDX5948126.1 nicotinamide riboside transporter PnuC [Zymomonas mobilis subsp. pomaceae]GEB89763.1 nicotinamide mononucleotide transporter [Zymomonas mobilis subsp. pomaceae]